MFRLLTLLSALFLCTTSFAQINMSQGLQLYLPFNGNAQDASGNANHGVVTGATLTTDQNGSSNNAYYFDGIDDKIEVSHSSSISPIIMTVCAKVKMEGFYNGLCYNNVIINKGLDYNSTESYYSLRTTATNTNGACNLQDTTNHNYRFDINGNGGLQMSTINNTPYVSSTQNTWDCLVGTYDGITQKIYVNGVLRYQNAVAQKPLNASDLTIGWYKELTPYPFWFKGKIDEVRIYDRVLNANEIAYYCQIPFPESTSDIESRLLDISITPNPSSDVVTIDMQKMTKDGQLSITSIEGKKILTQDIKRNSQQKIDVSHFANGLYLITIGIENESRSFKFLKN